MGDAGWDNPMTVNGKRIDPTPHHQVGGSLGTRLAIDPSKKTKVRLMMFRYTL
jgi:hypothetical protein